MDNKLPISLVVTVVQLERLTSCAHRMLGYADPGESLLITTFHAENGTPVRLVLDKRCFSRSPPCNILASLPQIHEKTSEVKNMSEKIKALFGSAKRKTDSSIAQLRAGTNEAIAVLKDKSGGNHTTEVIMGCVIAVVIGCLLLQTFTGFFSNTFWPLITGKITGMFK